MAQALAARARRKGRRCGQRASGQCFMGVAVRGNGAGACGGDMKRYMGRGGCLPCPFRAEGIEGAGLAAKHQSRGGWAGGREGGSAFRVWKEGRRLVCGVQAGTRSGQPSRQADGVCQALTQPSCSGCWHSVQSTNSANGPACHRLAWALQPLPPPPPPLAPPPPLPSFPRAQTGPGRGCPGRQHPSCRH